ncbi:MAG TPA: polyprenyl synthetase family protein [Cyclobacteriaceae bacterium]|nr:polyprenyl synthetase family protein [Cyclobacteriaceae bacterium]
MNSTKKYREIIDRSISELKFGEKPENLYGPVNYFMNMGGKRLRPMLVLMSFNLFSDGLPDTVVRSAMAVETFHNFTLMHDDIMDNAPLRRGMPTVHEKWNLNTAMLSGDVMLVRTYDLFLGLDPKVMRITIKKFNDCAAMVCEGQQLDMDFENSDRVTEASYLEMIRLKTAVLIGFSLELGAILGNAEERDVQLMKEFGTQIGIGFQLKDDLLDVYADNAKFGKQIGGDIIANKNTYLLIKARELAKGPMKKELDNWINTKETDHTKKVAAVTSIYNDLGIRKLTSDKISEYISKGTEALKNVGAPEQRKKDLYEFTEELVLREN